MIRKLLILLSWTLLPTGYSYLSTTSKQGLGTIVKLRLITTLLTRSGVHCRLFQVPVELVVVSVTSEKAHSETIANHSLRCH